MSSHEFEVIVRARVAAVELRIPVVVVPSSVPPVNEGTSVEGVPMSRSRYQPSAQSVVAACA